MVDRIREFIKNLTFLRVIWILTAVLIGLAVINAILFPSSPLDVLPGTTLSDLGVDQTASFEVEGEEISQDYSNYNEKRLLKIYVEDFSELSDRDAEKLIQGALSEAGLTRNQVYIVFDDSDYLEDTDDEYVALQEDPTDPATYREYRSDAQSEFNVDYEPLNTEKVSFDTWVDIVKPVTDDYEIYKTDEGKYLVVLKSEYTKEEFESVILSQFDDSDNFQFEYDDRTAVKEEESP